MKETVYMKTYRNFLLESKKKVWLFSLTKNTMLTKHTFETLCLSKPTTVKILEQLYTHMTKIQSVGIPFQICGFDLLGSARTGSGKTVAFSVPIIEFVYTIKWSNANGTAAIVLSPTRELTLQSYYVMRDLLIFHSYSYGIIMGGANRKTEEERIKKGITVLVATPGRLLDHLKNTQSFIYSNLQLLVIDEADRCLEIGFEDEIYEIINMLPKDRQTILFSATQTQNTEKLSMVSFQKRPIYLGVDDELEVNWIPEIEQNFLVCSPEDRFVLLLSILKKKKNDKIIVFFSSCNEVKFFSNLAKLINTNVLELHGKQKQFKRTSVFFEFCKAKSAILFCTDIAARGLDIPSIDWIFQADAPLEFNEYFHRVGRTSRGIDNKGKSLIFFLHSELGFLKFLKQKKIKISEYKFPMKEWTVLHHKISSLVEKNHFLNKLSKEAFKSFVNSYSSSSLRGIFDLKKINICSLSKSFGLTVTPNFYSN
nr:RNA-dependent helicase [Cryptomonas sp.]